jgi:hypothetical protein
VVRVSCFLGACGGLLEWVWVGVVVGVLVVDWGFREVVEMVRRVEIVESRMVGRRLGAEW